MGFGGFDDEEDEEQELLQLARPTSQQARKIAEEPPPKITQEQIQDYADFGDAGSLLWSLPYAAKVYLRREELKATRPDLESKVKVAEQRVRKTGIELGKLLCLEHGRALAKLDLGEEARRARAAIQARKLRAGLAADSSQRILLADPQAEQDRDRYRRELESLQAQEGRKLSEETGASEGLRRANAALQRAEIEARNHAGDAAKAQTLQLRQAEAQRAAQVLNTAQHSIATLREDIADTLTALEEAEGKIEAARQAKQETSEKADAALDTSQKALDDTLYLVGQTALLEFRSELEKETTSAAFEAYRKARIRKKRLVGESLMLEGALDSWDRRAVYVASAIVGLLTLALVFAILYLAFAN